MAGAKGLLSLPFVTARSKLRQLQLNTKLTFGFLPPSAALCLLRTLSPPRPVPGAILQPTLCIPWAIGRVCSGFHGAALRHHAQHGLLLPSTESEAGGRQGRWGPGGDGGDQAGMVGTRRGWWGPGRDGGDQHGWRGHGSAWELACCGNEQQN